MSDSTTHFGFQTVPTDEKVSRVRNVFDRVASRYDLMNDLMSFGLHRIWKEALMAQLKPRPGMHLLDLAGGTGDIAMRCLQHAPDAEVTICDINQQMLEEGRNRAIDANRLQGLQWICGNAEALPFEDMSFDACTIAFGIRNVTDIPKALKEMHRVLKPGGHFLCLEFSEVKAEMLAAIYETYSFKIIPQIGKMIVGDAAPYQYLVESIRRFPNQKTFAEMIRSAGFGNVTYKNMTGGVVALHSGWRV